jgi:hypothetical protein
LSRFAKLAACVFLVSLCGVESRAAEAPTWQDISVSVELVDRQPESMVPIWYDVNLDGKRDPLWLSYDGVDALVFGEDGTPSLVPVDMPSKYEAFLGPQILATVLDADGDGDEEILVLGIEPGLLEATAPYKLSLAQSAIPRIPGAVVGDVAAGDLNGDGLPDVVIGFGVFALDRIERRGYPDRILMNLGEGRFEWRVIEPKAYAFTHGMTLGDMDGDGRLDIVESFNSSQLTTLSRVLLNRTPPGGVDPIFEVAPYAHDTGTNGMGATIEDIDGDGLLDVYNTSVGLDQLCVGTPDGACQDATLERGLRAEWGSQSMRQQWSPTFADLNADGRVDLIVRHGIVSAEGQGEGGPTSEADLVYIQSAAGFFDRVQAPFERGVAAFGRQLVLGDLDDDGLPEVALGGLEGSAGFWLNETDAGARRPLTVRLQGTVGGHPPTGARITGVCDAFSTTRHLTSGGKMGGVAAPEIWLAFPDCDGEAQVTVEWPSGARSTHGVGVEERVLEIAEPIWFQIVDGEEPTLQLDPSLGGAAEACMASESTPWTCCAVDDAPCVLPVAAPAGEPVFVRLDDHRMRALSVGLSRWVLSSEPSPPRPGTDVIWRLHHVGDPARIDPDISLFVDGEVVEWKPYVASPSTLSATSVVPDDSEALLITLFPPDLPPAVTWSVDTASVFEPAQQLVDIYAYRVTGGVTETWSGEVFSTFMRNLELSQIYDNSALTTSDGLVLDTHKNIVGMSTARMRLIIDWEAVAGEETLRLVDLHGTADISFPLPEVLTLEEAIPVVDHVKGGMAINRLVVGGDSGPFFFTLHDKAGAVMPPEAELITAEVDGGTLTTDIVVFAGTYNLNGWIQTDQEVGDGEVRILSADGRLLGAFPFFKRAAGGTGVELAASSALLASALEGEAPATHRVRVFPLNAFDEFTGPGTLVTLQIEGGTQLTQSVFETGGGLVCLVEADPVAEVISIDVHLDGMFLTTLTAALEPAPPTDESDTSSAEVAEEEPPSADSGGCGGCAGSPSTSGDLWLVLAILWALRPRRSVS